MKVLVIGSHGQVGQRLVQQLVIRNHRVRAMVRKEEQMPVLQNLGAEAFLADLETDFSAAYQDIEVVIFTAGSGGHTGPEKTIDVDQNAAMRSMDIAKRYGVKHYIMVSAQGVREPEFPSKIQHYYQAKRKADTYLIASGLNYTIFRPGRLLDEMGSGKVQIAEYIPERGQTSRDNLAAVIAEAVGVQNGCNMVLEVLDGDLYIPEALNGIG